MNTDDFYPSLASARELNKHKALKGTLLPLCTSTPSDLISPTAIFLKLSSGATAEYSFLLESATGSSETIGRYSYIGANPRKVVRCGPGYDHAGDPLRALQNELQDRIVDIPGIKLPNLAGGAVGYLSYDRCTMAERQYSNTRRHVHDLRHSSSV